MKEHPQRMPWAKLASARATGTCATYTSAQEDFYVSIPSHHPGNRIIALGSMQGCSEGATTPALSQNRCALQAQLANTLSKKNHPCQPRHAVPTVSPAKHGNVPVTPRFHSSVVYPREGGKKHFCMSVATGRCKGQGLSLGVT